MILVTTKMRLDISQLLTSDAFFAHFIDESLAFHHELHSVYSYPALLHNCLHVLIQPEPFHKWKTIEQKCRQNRLKTKTCHLKLVTVLSVYIVYVVVVLSVWSQLPN